MKLNAAAAAAIIGAGGRKMMNSVWSQGSGKIGRVKKNINK